MFKKLRSLIETKKANLENLKRLKAEIYELTQKGFVSFVEHPEGVANCKFTNSLGNIEICFKYYENSIFLTKNNYTRKIFLTKKGFEECWSIVREAIRDHEEF